jgi:hypothetical protein
LRSLQHGFAGTVDLVYIDKDGKLVICDLKSRETGKGKYESDDIQTGAYALAWNETETVQVDYRTVLLVHEDGTFEEIPCWIDADVFLMLLSVYKSMRPES